MRTIAILFLLALPQPAVAGPLTDAVRTACLGPVARAIAMAQRPTIHPVAKVQPPDPDCPDGNCPVDVAPKVKVAAKMVEKKRRFGRRR